MIEGLMGQNRPREEEKLSPRRRWSRKQMQPKVDSHGSHGSRTQKRKETRRKRSNHMVIWRKKAVTRWSDWERGICEKEKNEGTLVSLLDGGGTLEMKCWFVQILPRDIYNTSRKINQVYLQVGILEEQWVRIPRIVDYSRKQTRLYTIKSLINNTILCTFITMSRKK